MYSLRNGCRISLVSTGPQLIRPAEVEKRNWLPIAVAVGVVVAVVIVLVLYFGHGKSGAGRSLPSSDGSRPLLRQISSSPGWP